MLLAIAAGLLALTVPDLDAPFGPSHDGRNAAMWALASDGVQAHGLVGSKFGARHADGAVYANHPPITGLVTAASVAVLGRSEVGVRIPGLLTALASIPLLWLLLTRLRLSPHAAAVGCAVALATPMFLGYGPMVDTPTMSFPIALALLAVWLAPRARPWLLASLAAAAVLAGWEACLLTAVVLAVELVRSRSGSRLLSRSLAAGFAAGLVSLSAWLLWVHGSLGPIIDTLTFRAGQDDPVRLSASLWAQADHLRSGFPLPVFAVAAAGCVLAVRRGGLLRTMTLVSGGVVATYSLVLRQAAFNHAYWSYWVLLPVAIGIATLVQDATTVLADQPKVRVVARHTCTALALVAVALSLTTTPLAKAEAEAEYHAAAPLRRATLSPQQNRMWVRGDVVMPASWVEFYARRPVRPLTSVRSLDRLARDHPTHLVFVHDASGYRLEQARRLRQDEARG